jgi:NAD(P)-dependent dehydrogenase (short-subunit alcohol dehydrogenase family)
VLPGERFAWPAPDRCTIRPDVRADYDALVHDLRQADRWPDTIAYLWPLALAEEGASPSDSAVSTFWRALLLVQALADGSAPAMALTAVTWGVHDVTGAETLDPARATVQGVLRVAAQEFPSLRCRHVDLDSSAVRADFTLVEALAAELGAAATEASVALRGLDRWIQTVEPVRLPAPDATPVRLRPRGTYLITGGLHGIGLVLAGYLADAAGANLVLVGRQGLPERAEWSSIAAAGSADPRAGRVLAVQDLERRGATVLVAAADVADMGGMRQVVEAARARFGAIHGVIHAAGIAGGGVIQLKSLESAAAVFAPKIVGTLALERALEDETLDFMVLCSSLASVVGGVGQVDYCAANAFLDAYARARTTRFGVPTTAIAWDTWSDTGMAVDTAVAEPFKRTRDAALRGGITSLEGIDVFRRALAAIPLPQLLVSLQPLRPVAASAPASAPSQKAVAPKPVATTHPRPRLSQPYAAPNDQVERAVCAVWEALIGVEPVGVHDSFFDLGGHSVLAIQAMAKINAELGTAIPVARLYEGLTPAFLAGVIRDQIVTDEQTLAAAPASKGPLPDRDQLRRRRLAARSAQEKTA